MGDWVAGDAVWYRQVQRGGYGFERLVPAVFIAQTVARVTIDVQLKGGEWKRIHVSPRNLEPRRRDGQEE